MPEMVDMLLLYFVCPKDGILSFYTSDLGSFQNTVAEVMLMFGSYIHLHYVEWLKKKKKITTGANKRIRCLVKKCCCRDSAEQVCPAGTFLQDLSNMINPEGLWLSDDLVDS